MRAIATIIDRGKLVTRVTVEGAARYSTFTRAASFPWFIMVARARVTRALTDLECTPRPAQWHSVDGGHTRGL